MSPRELRARCVALLTACILVLATISLTTTHPSGPIVVMVGSIGSLALLTWIAATVADAMVKSLKKEK